MRHIRFAFLRSYLVVSVLALVALPPYGFAGKKPTEKHLEQVRSRAEQGYVDQQIELAAAYLSGRGVAQDLSQAAHWYGKAAQAGNPLAQNLMGYFYQKGIGVGVDYLSSARWYQLSSSTGFALAKVNLGVLYLQGMGVPKNPQTARSLFMEAVDQG